MEKKYSLPFEPCRQIRRRPAPFHRERPDLLHCIDFAMPEGTSILAAREGVVVARESRYGRRYTDRRFIDRTNFVVIKHEDGEEAVYAHLQWRSILVKIGQRVRRGQCVATSGSTGYATYPHLHFGVYDRHGANLRVRFQ